MKLSYAQFLEDYHLDLVLGERSGGFYIDVGGGHPVADNVSYHFYLKGWRGLVVEPQAELAGLYAALRPRDMVADYLVGRHDAVVDFHRVERLHGFSTIVEANARGAAEFGAGYATEKKRIRPLSAILDDASISRVDFLKIDVEGAEADVLSGVDWRRHRPSVLCIEAIQPGSGAESWGEWEPIVVNAGYVFAFSDGLNRFYVARNEPELLERFPSAPTPWDVVTHFYELGQAHKRSDHPDHRLADRLIRGFLSTLPNRSEGEILDLLARTAPASGPDDQATLRSLFDGEAPFPGSGSPDFTSGFDDRARAALGRIAAQYDGGMVNDE